jgi:hypothetical protein
MLGRVAEDESSGDLIPPGFKLVSLLEMDDIHDQRIGDLP